ncbi:hypothetical protein [Glycomyces niveus]|uniref:Uncharacterized protein n=1 Tax=Glycomyces niveus TaxID=2820287 RepID=A0ABS3U8D8_9ACTN|nr:hypothetical protein [Glycomyces sp. NEAU-S30]MBO3734696.1 hypothetical protein [Glycomyces sp. NEAU-S30]
MSSIDEVISSLSANSNAVTDLQGQIHGTTAMAEEMLKQLQEIGLQGKAAALGAVKDQLAACDAFAAALQNKLSEAMTSAAAATGQ